MLYIMRWVLWSYSTAMLNVLSILDNTVQRRWACRKDKKIVPPCLITSEPCPKFSRRFSSTIHTFYPLSLAFAGPLTGQNSILAHTEEGKWVFLYILRL